MGRACSIHVSKAECTEGFVGMDVVYGTDSSDYGQEPVAGSCEHSDEPLGSMKCWESLE
jgi:hypothetical protein